MCIMTLGLSGYYLFFGACGTISISSGSFSFLMAQQEATSRSRRFVALLINVRTLIGVKMTNKP